MQMKKVEIKGLKTTDKHTVKLNGQRTVQEVKNSTSIF